MSSFTPTGRYVERGGSARIDARLVNILKLAAQNFVRENPNYRIEAFSGYRPGDKRQHGKGRAIDVRIVDVRTGQRLENYQSAGAKNFPIYEKFAHTARAVQQKVAPDMDRAFRWGGYFNSKSGPKGYGALDLMHFDVGGGKGLGMAGGSWDKGLTQTMRNAYPGVQSYGAASGPRTPTQLAMLPAEMPTPTPRPTPPGSAVAEVATRSPHRPGPGLSILPGGAGPNPQMVAQAQPNTLPIPVSAPRPNPQMVAQAQPNMLPAPPLEPPRQVAMLPATPVQQQAPAPFNFPSAPAAPASSAFPAAPAAPSGMAASASGSGLGSMLSGLVSALAASSASQAQAAQDADRQWQDAYAQSLGPSPIDLAQQMPREIAGSLTDPRAPAPTGAAVDPNLPTSAPTAQDILLELFGQQKPKDPNRLAMIPGGMYG